MRESGNYDFHVTRVAKSGEVAWCKIKAGVNDFHVAALRAVSKHNWTIGDWLFVRYAPYHSAHWMVRLFEVQHITEAGNIELEELAPGRLVPDQTQRMPPLWG